MLSKVVNILLKVLALGLFAIIAGAVLFVSYEWQIAGYSTYRRCRPEGGIYQVEWLFGVRPADNEWRRC